MLTAEMIALEEGTLLVVCCSVDTSTSSVVLVVWAGIVVVTAAESCSNIGDSLVNELTTAELRKRNSTVELMGPSSS